MCDTCGCSVSSHNAHLVKAGGKLETTKDGTKTVEVLQSLLHENDHAAHHNREHMDRHGVLAINLMSSPGSGKTSLLEATIEALKGKARIAVIEGDLETENDAERIRSKGVPAIQITTGSACHLDAHMVHDAMHHMALDDVDILFIENVGNLVCPASFDLGHHLNVTLLSVTEGDDKPAKYPVMFRAADLVLLTKSDLLAVLDDFSTDKAEQAVRNIANPAPVHAISARRADTLAPWFTWLDEKLAERRAGVAMRPKLQAEGAALHLGETAARHDHSHAHLHHEHSHDHGHHHHHGHGHAHDEDPGHKKPHAAE